MDKLLLIVDDHHGVADSVAAILDDKFDRIYKAKTYEEALNYLSFYMFSFIVLDLNLKGKNGANLIKEIADQHENPNTDTPVLIITGFRDNAILEEFKDRFAGILEKPFNSDELLDVVNLYVN